MYAMQMQHERNWSENNNDKNIEKSFKSMKHRISEAVVKHTIQCTTYTRLTLSKYATPQDQICTMAR